MPNTKALWRRRPLQRDRSAIQQHATPDDKGNCRYQRYPRQGHGDVVRPDLYLPASRKPPGMSESEDEKYESSYRDEGTLCNTPP